MGAAYVQSSILHRTMQWNKFWKQKSVCLYLCGQNTNTNYKFKSGKLQLLFKKCSVKNLKFLKWEKYQIIGKEISGN